MKNWKDEVPADQYPRLEGPQPPEAVVYIRCSDPKQLEKDLSLPAQMRICLDAVTRDGLQGSITFSDGGLTGTKDRRPGFQAAVKYALETPSVKAFVVYDTSRFARNREDAPKYKRILRAAKISIIYATQSFGVPEDPDTEMVEGLMELLDARYSKVLARVTLRGMIEKALRGEAPGGRVPYGYRKIREGEGRQARGQFVFDAVEIEAVRLIFASALSGIGKKAIVNMLHNNGLKNREGRPFHPSVVDRILRCPVYKGDFVFNRRGTGLLHQGPKDPSQWIEIAGYYPAIVTAEEWDRIQQARSAQRPTEVPGRRASSQHLLMGLLLHQDCGSAMAVERSRGSGGTYLYYSCVARRSQPTGVCEGLRIRADRAEPIILDFILKDLLSDEKLKALVRRIEKVRAKLVRENDEDRGSIEKELLRISAKIDTALDAHADGVIDKETLKKRVDSLNAKRIQLEARIASLPAVGDVRYLDIPARTIKYFREMLSELIREKSAREVRNFLSRFIDEIRISETEAVVVGRWDKPATGGGGASAPMGLDWLPLLDDIRTGIWDRAARMTL